MGRTSNLSGLHDDHPERDGRWAASHFGLRPTRLAAQRVIENLHHFRGHQQSELAREFDVSAASIANWVARAAADAGKPLPGKDVLSTAEREELVRLRRENRRLQTERDILAKATAWFAGQGEKTCTPSTR